MPISTEELRNRLNVDEPDYQELATLGSEAIPILLEFAQSDDPGLASKATSLAAMIPAEGADRVLMTASQSPYPAVRVAAAAGVTNLPTAVAADIVNKLLDDHDSGVLKVAIRAVQQHDTPELRSKIEQIQRADHPPFLADVAEATLKTLKDKDVRRNK